VPTTGRVGYLEGVPRANGRRRGTLVLLHAFPLNARMWEPQLAAMSERGWHVLAPDLGSDPMPTLDDYAGRMIDLLDGLHVHEAVVAGLSLGGYVAFALMRLAPRYVQGLVLADTRPQADTPDGVDGRKRTIALAKEQGVGAVIDQLLPKLLGATTRREAPEIGEAVRALALANSVDAVVGALNAMMTRPDSTPLLASIHVPTLIVVGDEDEITPPAVAQEMERGVAGSQLVVIRGAGHLSSVEKPEAFNDALARFLDYRV
jgi:pimeloyl-ACP methyl ester carboxylesterase